ncbi:head-tail connector protein [Thermaurantiacus sp.]
MLRLDVAAPVVPILELRTYLRIETDAEDAVLAGLGRAATSLVEAWTGRLLIERVATEIFPDGALLLRLSASPVRDVTEVARLVAGAAALPLPAGEWTLLRHRDDAADIQLARAVEEQVAVTYRAGMAADWNGLPDALRLAVMRAAGHLHANRDGANDAGLPAAVCQLLAPWRRLRLN